MVNQGHLNILKQGVDVWNQWRKEHLDVKPDLKGASITRTNLSKANLEGVDLSWANLRESKISFANLQKVNFAFALVEGADFREADFREANLHSTNFMGARLDGANFAQATISYTVFGHVDLSTTRGLETVNHKRFSVIGIDTIYLSHGRIPESFLKGTGVSDSFITYIHSLVNQPIDYYTAFISYSNKDQAFAERLYSDLQSKGVRCWFAPEHLKIGDHYHQHIDESIRLYDKLVLILSEHAVQSAWVEREVVAAREKEDSEQRPVLFPLRLDDAVMSTTKAWAADVRRRWHVGNFTQWKDHDAYQIAFDRLLRDLKKANQEEVEDGGN